MFIANSWTGFQNLVCHRHAHLWYSNHMSDESLVAAVRQLLGYSPGDTFEHLRTQVRTQASLFGEDIDAVLSEKEQLAVFHTICSAGK